MIEPASLIGFALVFVAASLVVSTVLCALVLACGRRLRRAGPRAERRAAAAAIVLGPVVGAIVTVALAAWSLAGPALGFEDHCLEHRHHLHLCLTHGGAFAGHAAAVVAIAASGAWLATRIAQQLAGLWGAHVALRRVARLARPAGRAGGREVLLVPAGAPFCFVAGIVEPRVFVSSAAWERLDAGERRALLAHELAHADQGDIWRRSALGMFAALGAPVLSGRALAMWRRATERLCDRISAAAVGDSSIVAGALVALARDAAAPAGTPATAFLGGESDVVDRVESVLAEGPEGEVAARRLGAACACAVALSALAAALLADPLHHALETLAGMI